MKRNPETGRYFPLMVDYSNNQLSIVDNLNQQKKEHKESYETRHVIKADGLYNLICLEYWLGGVVGNDYYSSKIFMSSDAIVHQIDGPLFFEEMQPWKEQLNKLRRK
jgi:hypothetical protein